MKDAVFAMAPQEIRFTPDGLDWKGMEVEVGRMGARRPRIQTRGHRRSRSSIMVILI